MRDQDIISRVTEFHDQIQAPATPAGEDARRGQRLLRRRRSLSVAAGVAAAVLAVGVAQASLPADSLSNDQGDVQPADVPSHPTPSETIEASPDGGASPDADVVVERVRRKYGFVPHIVMDVPGWSLVDGQETLTNECAYGWSAGAAGGGNFGHIAVTVNGERGWVEVSTAFFSSPSEASQRVAGLVDDLTSCAEAWQVQPIDETDVVVASSADGLIWIQPSGKEVRILQALTVDGPPPLNVQVEIAEYMPELW